MLILITYQCALKKLRILKMTKTERINALKCEQTMFGPNAKAMTVFYMKLYGRKCHF